MLHTAFAIQPRILDRHLNVYLWLLLVAANIVDVHVDKVRLPYNVNVLTQSVAAEVLGHPDVLARQAAAIRSERERLAAELSAIPGTEVFPSAANFVLFRIGNAGQVFDALKRSRVLIKNLHGSHPALENCLRVTVGTPAENRQFTAALRAIMAR